MCYLQNVKYYLYLTLPIIIYLQNKVLCFHPTAIGNLETQFLNKFYPFSDKRDDDAFEARDLENEVDSNEEVTSRLHKIERTLANERVQSNELQKSLQATYHVVDSLKGRLTTLV